MIRGLLKDGGGSRSSRGNLHCHSNRSDGLAEPEEVVDAYRDAGYDFLCLSDHFEEEYGWQVTDTRHLRSEGFTTILGAELSSAPWDDRHAYWVTAAGLPADFEAPPAHDHPEAIGRAADLGAFVIMLHPGLNNLPLAAADGLPGLDAVHAIEIYNHNGATAAIPDGSNGAYMLDGLLERGRKLLVNAGDDAHFGHPRDRFGGWVEVYSDRLDPDALLTSLKAGRYYSDAGTGTARADLGRRAPARGDERSLRGLPDHRRRPVAERVRAPRWGRSADHGGGVRPRPVPRLLLPRHRGGYGRPAGLEQSRLAVTHIDSARRRTDFAVGLAHPRDRP